MTFREKLVTLRKIRKITQDELASAVGVSRQAVYKWECGQSYPEVPKLLEIKFLFGISIDDLLDDSFDIALPEKKRKRRSKKADGVAKEAGVEISDTRKEEEPERPVFVPAVAKIEKVEVANAATTEEKVEEPAALAKVEEKPVEEAPVAAAPAEPAPAEEATPEKKKGFFGRLFGKK